MRRVDKTVLLGIALGLVGFLFVPWYADEEGFFSFYWLTGYPFAKANGPAWAQAALHGRGWLFGIAPMLLVPLTVLRLPRVSRVRSSVLIVSAAIGAGYLLAQSFAIGPLGWAAPWLEALFGPLAQRQFGLGYGALFCTAGFVLLLSEGLASRGLLRGDTFAVTVLVGAAALVSCFVVYPVAMVLLNAVDSPASELTSGKLWRASRNSLLLALLSGAGSTLLGLVLALAVQRANFKALRPLRLLSVLPIITPPFVIGLALILAFGRAGAVTTLISNVFGVAPSRYIFGLPGLVLAQLLAFTPVAFLTLLTGLEGISPSLEEAPQTLRASPGRIFTTVTLPLLRPAIAASFLLSFVESLADFGNPLILGGSHFEVLATEIFFSVAGAQANVARAAVMALFLLGMTLAAFAAQQRFLGKGRYTGVGGKGDGGIRPPLPSALRALVVVLAVGWTLFTVAIYALVLTGGFVKVLGHDNSFTLDHFTGLFAIDGGRFIGRGWDSLFTTLMLSAVAAPLTALMGFLVAWLVERQSFRGRSLFEFITLLAFAVPGTVIGVSYVLAFNLPPFDLIGTGIVLILCFVFRNMPVGIRTGVAALSQVDRSLDEASLTLRAGTGKTLWGVLLPLVRGAVTTGLVYGFVRAMTAVSAVIFLVSAEHPLSTTYILGQVEAGDYGGGIAYSSVLIVLMLIVIGTLQYFGSRAALRRRAAA